MFLGTDDLNLLHTLHIHAHDIHIGPGEPKPSLREPPLPKLGIHVNQVRHLGCIFLHTHTQRERERERERGREGGRERERYL